jgi:micrococcal nuclease
MSRKCVRIFSAIVISLVTTVSFPHNGGLTGAQGSADLSARVAAVHDGDTVSVMIGSKKERVRMIGIDAPELGQRPWGAKAKKHLEDLLDLSGWTVSLERDVEHRDKYGRLLGYLWTRDRKLINLQMLKDGYAVLFTVPPNVKHVNTLRDGQHYARERGLGIWGRDGLKERPEEYRRKHPR